MFEASGTGDDGWGTTPPPPAADRLWRHPSEVAAVRPVTGPAPTVARGHRFSLGTVVVATSMGALAMFASLAASGLVGSAESGITPTATSVQASLIGGAAATATTAAPSGLVAVRITGPQGTSVGAGLVFNTSGDIVTTLLPPGTGDVSVAVGSGGSSWATASVLGTDPATGITVIRPPAAGGGGRLATTAGARTADSRLGATVTMYRPPSGDLAARFRDASTRVTSTNTALTTTSASFVGLMTLTSARPAAASEVGIDPTSGAVAALVLPVDDNPEDEMSYAIPADVAVDLARQIEATGTARHGALAADLVETPDGSLVVVAVATPGGLSVGDEVLAVSGRPVHSTRDVLGVLVGVAPGESIEVTVRRDLEQRSVSVTCSDALGQLASTTTAP